MPTKRKRIGRHARAEERLDPETRRILAGGWSAPRVPEAEDVDPFRVFTYSDSELVALGYRHRAEVAAEARALGQSEPWFLERERQRRAWGRS